MTEAWQQIEWKQLGPQHLGRPVYIKYPPKYARDYDMGVFEGISVERLDVYIHLRGGHDANISQMNDGTVVSVLMGD